MLSNCSTFAGSVYILSELSSVTLPPSLEIIMYDLLAAFVADLDIPDSLVTVEADGLTKVGTNNPETEVDDLLGFFVVGNLSVLTRLDFPNLTFVGGGLAITNNPQLLIIDFPLLSYIGGSLIMTGSFGSISLPSIQHVGGNVNITSSNGSFQCPDIPPSKFGGLYLCGSTIREGALPTSLSTTSGTAPVEPSTTSETAPTETTAKTSTASVKHPLSIQHRKRLAKTIPRNEMVASCGVYVWYHRRVEASVGSRMKEKTKESFIVSIMNV
jgi:hypothetical protein